MKSEAPKPVDAPESAESAEVSAPDVALIHGVTADGGLQIIRRRRDRIEAGALHPLREGEPIHGEVLALRPRADMPLVCDVEVKYAPPSVPPSESKAERTRRKGPAQVASEPYRQGWDAVFSSGKKGELN